MSEQEWFLYEKNAKMNGYNVVCGVDEAGRGPLAGPVYAAAVILPENINIEGLNDSKKLTAKKRDLLFEKIKSCAVSWSVSSASVEEIDDLNILRATFLAMKRAVENLNVKPDIALVDGNQAPDIDIPVKTIVKGDALSASIAAASILAKVSRDRFIIELSKKYPQYLLEKHKGYGTKAHIEAIYKYGPADIHRKTFLKKILERKGK